MARLLFILVVALGLTGCHSISKAVRDSDDVGWSEKWGDEESPEDTRGAANPEPDKPPPPPATEPRLAVVEPAVAEPVEERSVVKLPARAKPTVAEPVVAEPAGPPPSSEKQGQQRALVAKLEVEQPPAVERRVVQVTLQGKPQGQPGLPQGQRPPTESMFLLNLRGGAQILRGMRVLPAVQIGFAYQLGQVLGWQGLYLFLEVGSYVGETQLYHTGYALVDGTLGFEARLPLGPLKLLVATGFGLRAMFLTQSAMDENEDPELGFGAMLGGGIEIPLGELLSILVTGDGRYMRDPITQTFFLSSVVGAGLQFGF